LRGELVVPGDKSVSHRAIMLGAIAEGVTRIDGFPEGEVDDSVPKAEVAVAATTAA